MDAEENQEQVSLRAHSPWKSLPRFPHFHRPYSAWKSGKPKAGFPLSHSPVCFSNPTQKGGLAAVAPLLPSGSFFNEKMLAGELCVCRSMYGFQSLLQVRDQIVGVLQADRGAQQVLRRFGPAAFNRRAVLDEAVRSAEARGARE